MLQELEALSQAEKSTAPIVSNQMPSNIFNIPTAPTHSLPQQQAQVESEDERALRELSASMGM